MKVKGFQKLKSKLNIIISVHKEIKAKINKLEKGENSVEIVNKRVSEISKLELNVII
jgi:hypothetical protein